jgi:hypothetical protein
MSWGALAVGSFWLNCSFYRTLLVSVFGNAVSGQLGIRSKTRKAKS